MHKYSDVEVEIRFLCMTAVLIFGYSNKILIVFVIKTDLVSFIIELI